MAGTSDLALMRTLCQTAMMTTDIAKPPDLDPADVAYILDPARPVLTHGRVIGTGQALRAHSHPRGQLLWAMRGVLRVVSNACIWLVPPSHAVWIPGGMEHQVTIEAEAELLNIYVDPSISVRKTNRPIPCCAVLLLTPLAREMIRRLGESDTSLPFDARLLRLCSVLLDELDLLTEAPLNLPGGQDERLTRVTRHLIGHPDEQSQLPELSQMAGASPRTMERLFRAETGLSFRQWRSKLRLLSAIEALNRGESSTTIAFSMGYSSPSAFIAAFREAFGTTPQRFLSGNQT
ncbi:helix-turn-helix transcriptional regulator [Xinfangfangia sp. CPCC 101601]|uniref:Helix-turn-helix transcriptional regulator n=1 Tax=Pseudogemmobacter lacusdianii TaxID=3069608 RepID=A0ABU0VZV0_9RHOB|nr:helix-turn-helix transcriptional regulator [Xinfangfangia sp. CPCC 101601]MDQ2067163.1 helix-turn-helix transcriptional regulator [Xinfangfangia sp. CPCC 101601]